MSRREEVLTAHREAIRAIAARHNAEHIALIGSVARGEDTEDSDCDFLADCTDFLADCTDETSMFDVARLISDLEALLECEVDVVSRRVLSHSFSGILDDAISL